LSTEQYQEVRPIMITTFERGKIAERIEMALLQLEAKFGPLAAEAKQRIEALSPEELRQTMIDFAKGRTLQELHLAD
jgi:hypothetical protein